MSLMSETTPLDARRRFSQQFNGTADFDCRPASCATLSPRRPGKYFLDARGHQFDRRRHRGQVPRRSRRAGGGFSGLFMHRPGLGRSDWPPGACLPRRWRARPSPSKSRRQNPACWFIASRRPPSSPRPLVKVSSDRLRSYNSRRSKPPGHRADLVPASWAPGISIVLSPAASAFIATVIAVIGRAIPRPISHAIGRPEAVAIPTAVVPAIVEHRPRGIGCCFRLQGPGADRHQGTNAWCISSMFAFIFRRSSFAARSRSPTSESRAATPHYRGSRTALVGQSGLRSASSKVIRLQGAVLRHILGSLPLDKIFLMPAHRQHRNHQGLGCVSSATLLSMSCAVGPQFAAQAILLGRGPIAATFKAVVLNNVADSP